MKKNPRIIVTCGGTAGHINPAIAIANAIKRATPDAEILFVGADEERFNDLVQKAGYPIGHIEVEGISRSLSLANVRALYLAISSPTAAKKMLRDWHADFVIGTGGYACWPMLKAASKLGIPCAVHESNVLPGMTVNLLQSGMNRIYVNFAESADYLEAKNRKKVLRVGNPLLDGFSTTDRNEARRMLDIAPDAFVVLSFGGSLGSATVNREMMDTTEKLAPLYPNVIWLHATGNKYYEAAMTELEERGLSGKSTIRWSKYIYQMVLHMAAADVVISRSGAVTLAELACLHKAAVLIPSPNVVKNHQYKNAKTLADAGAAYLLEEQTLNENKLASVLVKLMNEPETREKLEQAIAAFAVPNAADVIWADMQTLIPD